MGAVPGSGPRFFMTVTAVGRLDPGAAQRGPWRRSGRVPNMNLPLAATRGRGDPVAFEGTSDDRCPDPDA